MQVFCTEIRKLLRISNISTKYGKIVQKTLSDKIS